MIENLTEKAKVQCPVCFEYVSELKSGCHVIPRWQIILTKENNGRYFEISSKNVGNSQKDIKTKSWCESCEGDFAYLDGVGAQFFRDNPIFDNYKSDINKYAFASTEHYEMVKLFIGSIVIRAYLHRLNDGEVVGEEIFNDIYKAYLANKDVYLVLHDMRKFFFSTSSLPVPARGNIQLMINGFLVVVTLDKIAQEYYGVKEKELLIFNVTDPKHPFLKGFWEMLKHNRKVAMTKNSAKKRGRQYE